MRILRAVGRFLFSGGRLAHEIRPVPPPRTFDEQMQRLQQQAFVSPELKQELARLITPDVLREIERQVARGSSIPPSFRR